MRENNSKVVVVTGGTRGIGRAIVERLLREGMQVALCGKSRTGVDETLSHLQREFATRVWGEVADVSKLADVERFFGAVQNHFGGLDVLINNAGVATMRGVAELTPEEWHSMIDLNLTGVFYCCHQALPLFKQRGGGYVINISSLAGKNPFSGGAGYNASKFGLNGFSEALMLDARGENVRVSYIMPGSVSTEFGGQHPGLADDWKIAPEDIAEVVVALLAMNPRTLISRVEVRPSKPRKSS